MTSHLANWAHRYFFPETQPDHITKEQIASAVWYMARRQLTAHTFDAQSELFQHNYHCPITRFYKGYETETSFSGIVFEYLDADGLTHLLVLDKILKNKLGDTILQFNVDGKDGDFTGHTPTLEEQHHVQQIHRATFQSGAESTVAFAPLYTTLDQIVANAFKLQNISDVTDQHVLAFQWYLLCKAGSASDLRLCTLSLLARDTAYIFVDSEHRAHTVSPVLKPYISGMKQTGTITMLAVDIENARLVIPEQDLFFIDDAMLQEVYTSITQPQSLTAIVADILDIEEETVTYDVIAMAVYATLQSRGSIPAVDAESDFIYERRENGFMSAVSYSKGESQFTLQPCQQRVLKHNSHFIDLTIVRELFYANQPLESEQFSVTRSDFFDEKCRQAIREVHAARFPTHTLAQADEQQLAAQEEERTTRHPLAQEEKPAIFTGAAATEEVRTEAEPPKPLHTSADMKEFLQNLARHSTQMSPQTASMATTTYQKAGNGDMQIATTRALALLLCQNPETGALKLETDYGAVTKNVTSIPQGFFGIGERALENRGAIEVYVPRSLAAKLTWLQAGGTIEDVSSIKKPQIMQEYGEHSLVLPCALMEKLAPLVICMTSAIVQQNKTQAEHIARVAKAALAQMYDKGADYVDDDLLQVALKPAPEEQTLITLHTTTLAALIGSLSTFGSPTSPGVYVDTLIIDGKTIETQHWSGDSLLTYLQGRLKHDGDAEVKHSDLILPAEQTMHSSTQPPVLPHHVENTTMTVGEVIRHCKSLAPDQPAPYDQLRILASGGEYTITPQTIVKNNYWQNEQLYKYLEGLVRMQFKNTTFDTAAEATLSQQRALPPSTTAASDVSGTVCYYRGAQAYQM